MKTLTIKLAAPMQSFGNLATFNYRTTYLAPSKSAVIGMIAAALGYRRDDDERISALNDLAFAVRIDQAGSLMTEYQNVRYGKKANQLTQTWRQNLQDAVFVVAIGGDDTQIDQIKYALRHPKFSLFLGRRANVIAGVLQMEEFSDENPVAALKQLPWQASKWYRRQQQKKPKIIVKVIADAFLLPQAATQIQRDMVQSFARSGRKLAQRAVVQTNVKLDNDCYVQSNEHDIMAFFKEG